MNPRAIAIATELCKRFEGFRSKPYLCPAKVATIGYGSTHYPGGRKVTLADTPVTEAAARQMLIQELLNTYAPGALRQCPGLLVVGMKEPGKLAAIVDFTYNLGVGRLQTSTLRRRINAGDWEGAKVELMKWVRGGGRVLPGLIKRRQAEVDLI